MPKPVDSELVSVWLERLRAGNDAEKTRAASELSRLRIRTRGSVRTRGAMTRAASCGFPEQMAEDALSTVLAAFRDESPDVRREVACALGEWGDERAAEILGKTIVGDELDEDVEVRRAAVSALGTIGGPAAVNALCQVAENDPSDMLRYDALASLTELATQAESAVGITTRGAVRTRGAAVRTRGAAVRTRGGLATEAQQVVRALQRIRDNDQEKEHLRRMAEAALVPLTE